MTKAAKMSVDRVEYAGLGFATNTGSVYFDTDVGDHFTENARHLPTLVGSESFSKIEGNGHKGQK